MAELSTKPYLIRALHEWCTDSGYTPYLAVQVDQNTVVPHEFVRDGEIVLNLSVLATHRLKIDNELITFQARFAGVARELSVPIANVLSIYARETGQGMTFESEEIGDSSAALEASTQVIKPATKLTLSVVKNDSEAADESGIAPLEIPPRPPGGGRPSLTRIK